MKTKDYIINLSGMMSESNYDYTGEHSDNQKELKKVTESNKKIEGEHENNYHSNKSIKNNKPSSIPYSKLVSDLRDFYAAMKIASTYDYVPGDDEDFEVEEYEKDKNLYSRVKEFKGEDFERISFALYNYISKI